MKNLVELSKEKSKSDFIINEKGDKIYKYVGVRIIVTNEDDSERHFVIKRRGDNDQNVVFTYTKLDKNNHYYDSKSNENTKFYNIEKFEKRLVKLEKELSKKGSNIKLIVEDEN